MESSWFALFDRGRFISVPVAIFNEVLYHVETFSKRRLALDLAYPMQSMTHHLKES